MNSFNLELQLKNTEFAIKSKLKSLFHELRRFQFVIILVLKLKKNNKQNAAPLIRTQKQKQLFMTQTLIKCLNQSIVQL